MAVHLIPHKRMNTVVSRLPGVRAAVADEALEIGVRAEARLAAHRHSGNADIDVDQGRVDSYVSLVDPAALAIEFGHVVEGKYKGKKPKFVQGLYIVTGAAGLAG